MSDAEGEALIQKVASESPKLHSIGKYKVGFRDQKGLAPIEKLWGVGLSLVGAMDSKTGIRPNIGVYDMELENVHFEHETLKKETATYYEKRKAWLSKQETARWKRPLPYEVIRNDQNRIDGYRIGFEYEMNGVSQVQMSYFLMCGKRMFHLKSLYASENAASDGVALSKAAETFYCEADSEKVGRFDRKEVSEFWKKAKATPAGRAQAREALREFFLQYEIEHQNINTDDSELEARFEQMRTLLDRVFGVPSAFADGTEDSCFFAGWKSSWKQGAKGKRTCAEPEGLKNCGSGKLACNPSVFGNVCISDDFRQQATQVCHAEYLRESDKHDQEIAQIEASNPGAFQEVQEAADGLCSSEPYASSNYSLCTALYNRIEKINPESGAGSGGREPPGVDPSNYDEAFDTTQDLLQLVENHCMTPDKKSMYATVVVGPKGNEQVVDCAKAREVALSNLKKLDAVKDTTNFKAIEDRACEVLPPGFKAVKDTVKELDAVLEPGCTAAEKAKRGNCGSDILCAAAANLSMGIPIKVGNCDTHRDSCLVNAATAIVNSLWEAVKGLAKLTGQVISGLASDAWKGAKNLAKGFANFFGASYPIEDASSYKTVQFARSAGGLMGDFIKSPGESIKKFVSGIWNGINQWMMEDAFCQQWSGVAHLSKCLKPSSGWQCLSCKEAINGTCAIAGYLATEIAAAFFTGGAATAIKMSGVGAKVTSLLGKMSKAGKFAKAGLASKFPKLAKAASAGSKFAGTTGKVLKTGAKVTGKAGAKVGIFTLKVLSGSAKAIIRTLEKIPLVNIPVKVVRLGAEQGKKFIKWYAELNRKAFAAGSNFFRRPTKAGSKFAKMEAEGAAAAASGERKILAKEASEAPKGDGIPRDQASANGSGPEKETPPSGASASGAKEASSGSGTPRGSAQVRKQSRREAGIVDQNLEDSNQVIWQETVGFKSTAEELRGKSNLTPRDRKKLAQYENRIRDNERTLRNYTDNLAEKSAGRPLTEAEKDAVWRAHLVGEGQIGKDGTRAAKGNYTWSHIREKNRILAEAGFDAQTRENLMVDGVVGLEGGGFDIRKITEVPNSKPKMEEFLASADPKELEAQLQGLIDRRNELYTQKLSATRFDPALDKELRGLTELLDEKGSIHYNSVLQNKLGKNQAEWKEMLKRKRLEPTGAPNPAISNPVVPQVPSYSKTVDESLEALGRFERDYSGSGMADDFTALSKGAPSSQKKLEIEKRIAEQEAALKELSEMKKTHSGSFGKSSMKGARDAEVRIDMRSRSLKENLEKLKSEQKSLDVSIRSASQKIEELSAGDYREYALKNRLQGEQPFDARFNEKVRDQIDELKRIKKNFNPEDVPALNKVDLDQEIKRLEEFLKKSESTRGVTGPPGKGEIIATGGNTVIRRSDPGTVERHPRFEDPEQAPSVREMFFEYVDGTNGAKSVGLPTIEHQFTVVKKGDDYFRFENGLLSPSNASGTPIPGRPSSQVTLGELKAGYEPVFTRVPEIDWNHSIKMDSYLSDLKRLRQADPKTMSAVEIKKKLSWRVCIRSS